MTEPLVLGKYSVGVGDRFGQEAHAQLQACIKALEHGTVVTPVWNKSNREHNLIGSEPAETRAAADRAVRDLAWPHPYFVDADHINLATVNRFLPFADFYTIDVADFIGRSPDPVKLGAFIGRHPELTKPLRIHGIADSLRFSPPILQQIAEKYLCAIQAAGEIYRHIVSGKIELAGATVFIPEVSMDETDSPQTPSELLVILAGLADEGVPVQTIAPKFSGRFNKGIDYIGNLAQFEREFTEDLRVLSFAVSQYSLPASLKLSIHSGSDKFSLYPIMRRVMREVDTGVHLKTAGTSWLEELIGLAQTGGEGLQTVKTIYRAALGRVEELSAPYSTVIHIEPSRLPSADEVSSWDPNQFVHALRHDPKNPAFNSALRQLLHISFKVAAEMGPAFTTMLGKCRAAIAQNVGANLFQRHIAPLFLEQK